MADKDFKNDPIEKRSLSKVFFFIGSFAMVVSFYAMVDEGIIRRTWKQYQAEFQQIELDQAAQEYDALAEQLQKRDVAIDQKLGQTPVDRLPRDPSLLSVKQLDRHLERARISRESVDYKRLQAELAELQIQKGDVSEQKGFAKATQDEVYYEWKHAQHLGKSYDEYEKHYFVIEKEIAEIDGRVQQIQQTIDAVQQKLAKYDDEVSFWEKAKEKHFAALDAIQRKITNIKDRPIEIKQIVIEDLGLQDPVEWGKVDRCTTCHAGVEKAGFEDVPDTYKTHPHRDPLLKAHNPTEFGCTTCHWGQGRAVQIKHEPLGHDDFAHGFEHHWLRPLLQGDFQQSQCFKCHQDQWKLDFAPVAMKGKKLFFEKGCIGCHNIQGFEDFRKAGPSLTKVAEKVHPEWIVDWILEPRSYDPHTYMPQAPLDRDKATKIASYLMQSSEKHQLAFGPYPKNGNAQKGEELFREVGCFGCHALEDEGSKFAPTLDRIMEKTDPDWVYNWILDPKSFYHDSKMPNLRLTKSEAAHITAYLSKKGQASETNAALRKDFANPKLAKEGYVLITQYGCYGCHNIKGTETLSKLSVDLTTFGRKTVDKLDFGDAKIPHTWEDWTFNKIKQPDSYVHTRSANMMPKFPFTEEELHSLVVFLKGMQGEKVPPRFVMSFDNPRQQSIDRGRNLVNTYNCMGCHIIEGEGGEIRDVIQNPIVSPPNLAGQGRRVQPAWLAKYLKNPAFIDHIRPAVKVRMPQFGFSDQQVEDLVNYFAALDNQTVTFDTVPQHFETESVQAGQTLASSQYFNCAMCHAFGNQPASGMSLTWGPNLALVPERIRPEFLAPWVQNPQAINPNVIMPAFLPVPDSGVPGILDADIDAQAKAISDYILKHTQEVAKDWRQ